MKKAESFVEPCLDYPSDLTGPDFAIVSLIFSRNLLDAIQGLALEHYFDLINRMMDQFSPFCLTYTFSFSTNSSKILENDSSSFFCCSFLALGSSSLVSPCSFLSSPFWVS